jgi:acetate kinase
MLVKTILKKSPAKAAMAITAAKRQEVAAHCYAVLAVTDFAMLCGGVGESCFLNKKVAKWYRRLTDC